MDSHLVKLVKRQAAAHKQSVSKFVANTLRQALTQTDPPRRVRDFQLITAGNGGLRAGVDLGSAAKWISDEDAAHPKKAGR